MVNPEALLQVCVQTVDEVTVSSLLSLQYPNGRTHELESAEEKTPGQEFDLYGHRWKVVGDVRRTGSKYGPKKPRLLCRQSR